MHVHTFSKVVIILFKLTVRHIRKEFINSCVDNLVDMFNSFCVHLFEGSQCEHNCVKLHVKIVVL